MTAVLHWSYVVLVAVVLPLSLSYCLYRLIWWWWEERRH